MRAIVLALIGALGLAVVATGVGAAPETSPLPVPRPDSAVTRAAQSPGTVAPPRPQMSPGTAVAAASLVPLARGTASDGTGPGTGAGPDAGAGAATGLLPRLSAAPAPRPGVLAAPGAPALGAAPGSALALMPDPPDLRRLPPPPRPDRAAPAQADATPGAPPDPETAAAPETPPAAAAPVVLAVAQAPRPPDRPAPGIRTTPGGVSLVNAFRTRPQTDLARPAPGGRLCGARGIEGEVVAPIVSRVNGCGIPEPVRVNAVQGVQLSTGALMDCPTALALQAWVRDGVIPTIGDMGGGPASLTVASHYACKTRNSQPGARLPEHGRGRAIDISAIVLADGTPITLLNGWRDVRQGPILRALHRAACGVFGTVLGPDSDGFHRSHFHFDTAQYRSGPFCR